VSEQPPNNEIMIRAIADMIDNHYCTFFDASDENRTMRIELWNLFPLDRPITTTTLLATSYSQAFSFYCFLPSFLPNNIAPTADITRSPQQRCTFSGDHI
jgi:hypothetical protein